MRKIKATLGETSKDPPVPLRDIDGGGPRRTATQRHRPSGAGAPERPDPPLQRHMPAGLRQWHGREDRATSPAHHMNEERLELDFSLDECLEAARVYDPSVDYVRVFLRMQGYFASKIVNLRGNRTGLT